MLKWPFTRTSRPIADTARLLLQRALDHANAEIKMLTQTIAEDRRDIPSILDQTKWPCGFFHFGKAENDQVRYFNCSITRRDDGLWLLVRRSHLNPKYAVGMNDLVAFKLEGKTPVMGMRVQFPVTLAAQQHEDPRVCKMGDHWFVSATTFQISQNPKQWTGAHQCVGRVTPSWAVDYLADPIYGNNGGSPLMNKGNEKNWLWFAHDGHPHLVYWTNPHKVVRFTNNFEADVEYITYEYNPIWQFGEARGGTPPVRVGDEYFTFFHSSTPWRDKKRRYHMGALAFKAEEPFPITRMTSLPLLSGSKRDRWHDGLPLVVFPCGALHEDGKWLVTMGINDCCSAWIEIPHDDLCRLLRPAEALTGILHHPINEPFQTSETIAPNPEVPASSPDPAKLPVAPEPPGSPQRNGLAEPPNNPDGAGHAPQRVSSTGKRSANRGKRG